MLNKISEKFHAWAKGWRVIILFIADALMMGYVMPLAGGDHGAGGQQQRHARST